MPRLRYPKRNRLVMRPVPLSSPFTPRPLKELAKYKGCGKQITSMRNQVTWNRHDGLRLLRPVVRVCGEGRSFGIAERLILCDECLEKHGLQW